jgi:hypothetical protein
MKLSGTSRIATSFMRRQDGRIEGFGSRAFAPSWEERKDMVELCDEENKCFAMFHKYAAALDGYKVCGALWERIV